ncbi:MAG: hypothetical protein DCC55_32030 [Chloroflexi bacterium]|nr:MAG: hypothetical protein DCC55_32030 [Chloroflexota bacterium]
MKCDKSGLARCASRPVINYCLNNVTADVRRQLDALDLTAVEDYCLQRCGDCFAGPFLVVDGRLVTGDSHAQILRNLYSNQNENRSSTLHPHSGKGPQCFS